MAKYSTAPRRFEVKIIRPEKCLGQQHPELGFLGGEAWFGRTTVLVSYWRSTEHLLAYAKSRTAAHMPAWRDFNQRVGTNCDVGIWH